MEQLERTSPLSVRWGLVLLVDVAAAVLTFVAMYLVVVVYAVVLGVQAQGEPDQTLIQQFAVVVGAWLGTVLGLLFTFDAAAWVARTAEAALAALQGALVGVVVAVVGVTVGGSLGIARLP